MDREKNVSDSNLEDARHYVLMTANNDPTELKSFYHKFVVVKTVDGVYHEGWVKTIDPVSGSVLLVRFCSKGEPEELEVILGHAISSMKITSPGQTHESQLNNLFNGNRNDEVSALSVQERKENLKCWLGKNHIPIHEHKDKNKDVLTVAGSVVVTPPYRPQDCICVNEIVLGKIQGLIAAMPNDIQDWETL